MRVKVMVQTCTSLHIWYNMHVFKELWESLKHPPLLVVYTRMLSHHEITFLSGEGFKVQLRFRITLSLSVCKILSPFVFHLNVCLAVCLFLTVTKATLRKTASTPYSVFNRRIVRVEPARLGNRW